MFEIIGGFILGSIITVVALSLAPEATRKIIFTHFGRESAIKKSR